MVTDGVHHSLCRVCQAFCGINVTVEDGRVVKVIGDAESPNTHGYTCAKGRSLPEQLGHTDRLLGTFSRNPDGSVTRVDVDSAIADVATRLTDILAKYGPRSVAIYFATGAAGYPASVEVTRAFGAAIRTPMFFSPATIDQPGKQIAAAMHGRWGAHARPLRDSELWLFIGANPVLSMWGGTALSNPRARLQEFRERGGTMVVIDPRRTETARLADIHLRPFPGRDPELIGSLIREVLNIEGHDASFCAEHVTGLDGLRVAVESLTPDAAQALTGVPAADVRAAAALMASSRRGGVTVGTGPNMAPRGPLSEYLSLCLHSILGYWPRQGEVVTNPGVLAPARQWVAQPEPSVAAMGDEMLRVRGLRRTAAGMPTGALADEILTPGPGQVRALLCIGGNPVAQWPDEAATRQAMASLDLLVCFDVRPTETTRYAHFTVGTKMHLEVPQMTNNEQALRGYGATSASNDRPFAMYAPRLVSPPEGAQVVEEWEFILGLAKQMGLSLEVGGQPVDSSATTEELFGRITATARIPLSEVARYPHGHLFDDLDEVRIEPPDEACTNRLVVDHSILSGLESPLSISPDDLLLIVRRRLELKNSFGRDLPGGSKTPFNPLGIHPSDLARLGLTDGALVEVTTARGRVRAFVSADETLLPGTVSLTHGFGARSTEDGHEDGANPNRLIGSDDEFDSITGQPRMNAIPVRLTPVSSEATAAAASSLTPTSNNALPTSQRSHA